MVILDLIEDLVLEVIKDKTKGTIRKSKLRERINTYISVKQEENLYCSLAEEIDFEGFALYAKSELYKDIISCITQPGDKQNDRIKTIVSKAINYAKADNRISKERVERVVRDIIDIVNAFYRDQNVNTSELVLVGEIELKMDDGFNRVQKNIKDGNEELINKIEETCSKFSKKEQTEIDRYINSYVSHRQETIMNTSILPWFKHNLEYKEAFPNLFIEPFLQESNNTISFNNLINNTTGYINQNIAILGEAGAGKSTLMRYIFAFRLIKGINCIYITAKEAFVNNILDKIIYRASLDDSKHYLVFIDGIDEKFAYDYAGYKDFMIKLQGAVNITFWLGCRTDFYEHNRYEDITFIIHDFTLIPWDETQYENFINEYAIIIKNESVKDRIKELVGTDINVKQILTNPFKLALVAFLAHDEESELSDQTRPISGIYDLYERFILEWIKREKSRGTTKEDNNTIINTLRLIAHTIYDGGVYELNPLIENNSAIRNLLIIESKYNIYDTRCATAFYHQSIAAFLLAQNLFEAFVQNNTIAINKLLYHKMKDDVTNFIGDKFTHIDDKEKDLIKRNLSHLYFKTSETELSIKEQLVYYITRSGIDVTDFLYKVIQDNPTNPIMRLTLAYGCVLSEDQIIREYALNYAKSISNGSIDAITNRAWTVIYFGDVNDRDPYKYKDDEKRSWENARKARIKRFTRKNPRLKDYRFRLFDIPLFYSFLKDRKWNNISMKEYEILRSVDFPKHIFTNDEIAFLKKEKQKLLVNYKKHLMSKGSIED